MYSVVLIKSCVVCFLKDMLDKLSVILHVTRAVIAQVRSFYLYLPETTRLVKLKLSKLTGRVYFQSYDGHQLIKENFEICTRSTCAPAV